MTKNKNFLLKLLALLICAAISTAVFYVPSSGAAGNQGSEFRGIWVATVSNIDYPYEATTNSETLKNEMITILDNCKDMGFNDVFFQVRPSGDAFYKSDIFPWSKYLTGAQGQAPDNGFDPLEFALNEAHARGLRIHAWINPYRITTNANENKKLAPNNPAVINPNLVLYDSEGRMFYNPGDSEALNLIVEGVSEILEKYAIDGIHLDDYFYPSADYNDDVTYSFHKNEYPDKGDWRRANVDKLIEALYKKVHSMRPDIPFGVSPRGIWANKSQLPEGSDTTGGSSYFDIYCDSRGWIKKGLVDYIIPQIYWHNGHPNADYKTLCDWWADVVEGTNVKLYIGEGAYRLEDSTDIPAWTGDNGINELRSHIEYGRSVSQVSGYSFFNYSPMLRVDGLKELAYEINVPLAVDYGNDAKTEANDGKYKNKFTDMNDYWWAMDAVNSLAATGVIKGRSETEFDPDSKITRADNTVMLLRVLHKTAGFSDNFDDVYPDKYYYNEIGMAKALKIAEGVGDNLFDPDAKIRRQDMVTLAYRVLVREGVLTSIPNTTTLNKFSDNEDIYFYAREAMAACVDKGLISGYGDNTIKPNEYASRVEVALFIYRISQLIA